MAYEKKPNEGSLWKNDTKVEGDTRPNARGSIDVRVTIPEGAKQGDTIIVPMWISAWTNVTKDKVRWQKVVLKEKEARAPVQNDFDARYPSEAKEPVTLIPAVSGDDLNDSIPF